MRIVSLCPSLTELVFDLGRGADLVGITKFCVHPAGLVDEVEKVGGIDSVNGIPGPVFSRLPGFARKHDMSYRTCPIAKTICGNSDARTDCDRTQNLRTVTALNFTGIYIYYIIHQFVKELFLIFTL